MKKSLKSKKALSPVVAAIILIAVTVALSIAVAVCMGALSFTFMQTEEISFTGHTWDSSSPPQWIQINVKNTGSAHLTLNEIQINDASAGSVGQTLPYSLTAGDSVTFNVTLSGGTPYTSGIKYEFKVVTAKGNIFGPYIRSAP